VLSPDLSVQYMTYADDTQTPNPTFPGDYCKKFSKVLYIVTLYIKYSKALTFENLCPGDYCNCSIPRKEPEIMFRMGGLTPKNCLYTIYIILFFFHFFFLYCY
jgi:hypothetical protein